MFFSAPLYKPLTIVNLNWAIIKKILKKLMHSSFQHFANDLYFIFYACITRHKTHVKTEFNLKYSNRHILLFCDDADKSLQLA